MSLEAWLERTDDDKTLHRDEFCQTNILTANILRLPAIVHTVKAPSITPVTLPQYQPNLWSAWKANGSDATSHALNIDEMPYSRHVIRAYDGADLFGFKGKANGKLYSALTPVENQDFLTVCRACPETGHIWPRKLEQRPDKATEECGEEAF